MNEQQYPHLTPWVRPSNYIGKSWYGWYSVIGHHRDSDILTESNYDCVKELLLPLNTEIGIEDDDARNSTYFDSQNHTTALNTVEENRCHHWAVGWIESLMIHESNTAALERAEEIMKGLEDDYPVLDDEDFSRREDEAQQEAWGWMSVRDRVKCIQKYARENTSVFAARRGECPSDWGIREYLNQP